MLYAKDTITRDFIAVELYRGQLRYIYDSGDGAMVSVLLYEVESIALR